MGAEHADEELVLWDPFCGTGVVLLEALGIVLGHPPGLGTPGGAMRWHDFRSWPCHDKALYKELIKKIEAESIPHSAASRLTLLGSDPNQRHVDGAQRNLRRL